MELEVAEPEFLRVWSRVAPGVPGHPGDMGGILTALLLREQERLALCRALGLGRFARGCMQRSQALRRGLFFLAGDTPLPRPIPPNPPPDPREGLRRLYQELSQGEEDYRREASVAGDANLTRLFYRCAESCAAQRQQLWQGISLP